MPGLRDVRLPPPPFSRPLAVDEVPPEGLDLMVSATEAERQALAAQDGLAGLAKLEGALHIAPWGKAGLAVSGEMRARVTQICVVSLDPFDSELVEPIDVKFAPAQGAEAEPKPTGSSARGARAATARRQRENREPVPVVPPFEADDPPDPIFDGHADLGALVAEFLALALDPYPRKPGVAFDTKVLSGAEATAHNPFAELEKLKRKSAEP
ncbi:MAG: DUF177 domain-containing protein [Beijerinckiaceae bacterium]